ncbi:MAG: archaeosortase/exosortase family protein [Lentimicrobiaceae bacterium]|nr:archaeosortase/exosortase family protein [Lentimicrobiaceae bacterium]
MALFQINDKLRPFTDALLAAVITYGFHLLYRYFASDINSWAWVNWLNIWLSESVFYQSLWINQKILGLQIQTEEVRTMIFSNGGRIWINFGCSGLKLMFQVTILFLLFPGPWKHKLWYIPLGWILMHLSNLFRIVSLSVIILWKPQYWDFSHDWILRPFFYLVIFTMWVIWVEKFKNNPKKNKRQQDNVIANEG